MICFIASFRQYQMTGKRAAFNRSKKICGMKLDFRYDTNRAWSCMYYNGSHEATCMMSNTAWSCIYYSGWGEATCIYVVKHSLVLCTLNEAMIHISNQAYLVFSHIHWNVDYIIFHLCLLSMCMLLSVSCLETLYCWLKC